MNVTIVPELIPMRATLAAEIGGHGHLTHDRAGLELRLTAMGTPFVGRGEASPVPRYSPDSLEDATQVLEELSPFELSLPDRPEQCRSLVAELCAQLKPCAPSARCAFEGALVELLALHLNCSVATLLSTMAERSEGPASRLHVSRLVPTSDVPTCLAATRRAWRLGYRTFKLKLGPDADAVALCAALRSHYGQEIRLRFDPNASFAPESLGASLEALRPYAPELVEEPAPWQTLVTLGRCPIPLALDESLVEPRALPTLLEQRQDLNLVAIVVKPMLHGLLGAIALARQAQAAELAVIVTHSFDGPVGHATAASLALALGNSDWAHGLAPHPALLLNPRLRILGLGQGQLQHEPRPGLPLFEVPRC